LKNFLSVRVIMMNNDPLEMLATIGAPGEVTDTGVVVFKVDSMPLKAARTEIDSRGPNKRPVSNKPVDGAGKSLERWPIFALNRNANNGPLMNRGFSTFTVVESDADNDTDRKLRKRVNFLGICYGVVDHLSPMVKQFTTRFVGQYTIVNEDQINMPLGAMVACSPYPLDPTKAAQLDGRRGGDKPRQRSSIGYFHAATPVHGQELAREALDAMNDPNFDWSLWHLKWASVDADSDREQAEDYATLVRAYNTNVLTIGISNFVHRGYATLTSKTTKLSQDKGTVADDGYLNPAASMFNPQQAEYMQAVTKAFGYGSYADDTATPIGDTVKEILALTAEPFNVSDTNPITKGSKDCSLILPDDDNVLNVVGQQPELLSRIEAILFGEDLTTIVGKCTKPAGPNGAANVYIHPV